MLTVANILCEGVQGDADLFKKDLSLLPFDEDDDDMDGEPSEGYILRHQVLGLTEKVKGKNEYQRTQRVLAVVKEWIQIWNRERSVQGKAIDTNIRSSGDLLLDGLDRDHRLDFASLMPEGSFADTETYRELVQEQSSIQPPPPPKLPVTPPQPKYVEPRLSLSQSLFRKKAILQAASAAFDEKLEAWQRACRRIELLTAEKRADHGLQLEEYELRLADLESRIDRARQFYEAGQDRLRAQVDAFADDYRACTPEAVERYVGLVLDRSGYPELFSKKRKLEYDRNSRTLFLGVELPHPDQLSGDGYDDLIYRVMLRHLHELFSSDQAGALDAVQLSGWVHTLNRGNGQYEDITIISLPCGRQSFNGLNLRQVDPGLCFRFLKGVSAPRLSELIPIPEPHHFGGEAIGLNPDRKPLEPIGGAWLRDGMQFPDLAGDVAHLFEKEFGMLPGGITWGPPTPEGHMEAWGIDPEPIRGGKFLLQVRRGDHPVSASAVKELYGSMVHEGASKGILLSSKNFDPDAQAFARSKPIILLDAQQLKLLFEKHGLAAGGAYREPVGR